MASEKHPVVPSCEVAHLIRKFLQEHRLQKTLAAFDSEYRFSKLMSSPPRGMRSLESLLGEFLVLKQEASWKKQFSQCCPSIIRESISAFQDIIDNYKTILESQQLEWKVAEQIADKINSARLRGIDPIAEASDVLADPNGEFESLFDTFSQFGAPGDLMDLDLLPIVPTSPPKAADSKAVFAVMPPENNDFEEGETLRSALKSSSRKRKRVRIASPAEEETPPPPQKPLLPSAIHPETSSPSSFLAVVTARADTPSRKAEKDRSRREEEEEQRLLDLMYGPAD